VLRRVQATGHEDSWVPAQRAAASFLAQSGTLQGLTGMRRGLVMDVNPVVTGRSTGAPVDTEWEYDQKAEFGGNVRWGITPNLTLNGTINPDFAEVEADTRQINLTRFPLFFPEKRPFFTEGASFFDFGLDLQDTFIPFYSRRVGLFEGHIVGVILVGDTVREDTLRAYTRRQRRAVDRRAAGGDGREHAGAFAAKLSCRRAQVGVLADRQVEVRALPGAQHLGRPRERALLRQVDVARPERRGRAQHRPQVAGILDRLDEQHEAAASGRRDARRGADRDHADVGQQRAHRVEQRLRHDHRVGRRHARDQRRHPGPRDRVLAGDDGVGRADAVEVRGHEVLALEHAAAGLAALARRCDQPRDVAQPLVMAACDPVHQKSRIRDDFS